MSSTLIKIFLAISFVILSLPIKGIAQEQQDSAQKIEIPSSVKEELHRYMGYEDLLPKYLSLPYDVTMNTNVGGSFLDLSFLFLIFIPILLLIGLKNTWLKLGIGIFMLFFLVLSNTTGYGAKYRIPTSQVGQQIDKDLAQVPFSSAPLRHVKLSVSQAANTIYRGIDKNIIQKISGEGDSVTYPIFFFLFIGAFFILSNRLSGKPVGEQALVYLGLLYCFLWLILGAGIPWYGILMVALGLIYIAVGFLGNSSIEGQYKYARYVFLAAAIFWMSIAFSYRMSNYNPLSIGDQKGAIHIAPLFYGLGKKNKAEVLDELFRAYRPVVEEINNNPQALVYRAGTYFQYFITKNNERVTYDNQLEFFNDLVARIPNKVTLAKALKKSGYEYMLIDVKLAGIDATPEKSLEKKAEKLQNFLVNNPAIEPIGTDRIIRTQNGQFVYGFSGGTIENIGSFVAFKIK